jgi:hypothetical protein
MSPGKSRAAGPLRVGHRPGGPFPGALFPGGLLPVGPQAVLLRMAALVALALLAAPTPGAAQVGAFGGAPAGLDVAGERAHARAPLFTGGAVFAGAGEWSGTGLVGLTTGSFPAQGGQGEVTVDYEVTQTALAAFHALSDGLLVGVSVQPWNEVSLSAQGETVASSGRGDLSLQARYRAWASPDGSSTAALGGSVGLPVGADGFGTSGVVAGVSGAFSRQHEGGSLHASLGVALPFDDADGDATTTLTGALVQGVGERVSVAGELQARFAGGEHLVDLIPGVRFQPSPRVFVDLGVLLNVASSLDSVYDAGVVLAVRFGGN